MGFPEDNFLPVKSSLDDMPPTGGIEFFQSRFEQLEGLLLIINERRKAVLLSEVPDFMQPLKLDSATINFVRAKVEECFPLYLDDVVHPSGIIEGEEEYTTWTLETILAAITLGVDDDWTKMPARNPYSIAATGGALTDSDQRWREHINEILSVANRLNYGIIPMGYDSVAKRVGFGNGNGSVDCPGEKSSTIANWNVNVWNEGALGSGADFQVGVRKYAYFSLAQGGAVETTRGKLTADLSGFATGAAAAYLKLTRATRTPPTTTYFGQTTPNASAEDTFGQWFAAGLTAGSLNTTGYVDTTEDVPNFDAPLDTCPAASTAGWNCSEKICIVTPVWDYFV